MLPEEPEGAVALLVDDVQQRVRVLRQRRRENHDFVLLRHFLQKLLHARPHQHMNVVDLVLQLDFYHHVRRTAERQEPAVHQRLVQIQHQRLLVRHLRRKKTVDLHLRVHQPIRRVRVTLRRVLRVRNLLRNCRFRLNLRYYVCD